MNTQNSGSRYCWLCVKIQAHNSMKMVLQLDPPVENHCTRRQDTTCLMTVHMFALEPLRQLLYLIKCNLLVFQGNFRLLLNILKSIPGVTWYYFIFLIKSTLHRFWWMWVIQFVNIQLLMWLCSERSELFRYRESSDSINSFLTFFILGGY